MIVQGFPDRVGILHIRSHCDSEFCGVFLNSSISPVDYIHINEQPLGVAIRFFFHTCNQILSWYSNNMLISYLESLKFSAPNFDYGLGIFRNLIHFQLKLFHTHKTSLSKNIRVIMISGLRKISNRYL